MPTFASMKQGYSNLWNTMTITRSGQVAEAARKIIAGRTIYQEVENQTGVPWILVGALHMRECDNNMRGCLANGELIIGTGRKTRLVPRGRGPYSDFVESAVDALKLEGFDKIKDWSIERILYSAEQFNGWGYLGKGNSPYVWAGSNHYTGGKYVSDGVYSSSAVDPQLGVAPVIKKVMDITGAKSIPTSSRSQWTAQWGKWLGLGGGGLTAVFQQFSQFFSDYKMLIGLIAVAVGAGLVFWYLERQKVKEYNEGRYIPSGETKIKKVKK